MTTTAEKSGTYALGDRSVHRLGYGAMQLAGPHVMGPPADRDAAVAVLRRAVELGVDHIDTSDYYGPHVTNEIIREALHPYPDELTIVTKVGARRTPDGHWPEALAPDELRAAVHDNLDHLGVDVLDVVNLRMPGFAEPVERSLAEPFEALVELQEEGLIRHLGVSNVTTADVRRGAVDRPGRLRAEPLQPRAPGRRPADRRAGPRGHRLRAVLPARRLHARSSPRPWRRWPGGWRRRRWRSRSPGCWPARRTCC